MSGYSHDFLHNIMVNSTSLRTLRLSIFVEDHEKCRIPETGVGPMQKSKEPKIYALSRYNIAMRFKDRAEAGRLLAKALAKYESDDVVVFALPRGGVVLGNVVANYLHAPLDLLITRKIGYPGNEECAVCAVAEEGDMICDSQRFSPGSGVAPGSGRKGEARGQKEEAGLSGRPGAHPSRRKGGHNC